MNSSNEAIAKITKLLASEDTLEDRALLRAMHNVAKEIVDAEAGPEPRPLPPSPKITAKKFLSKTMVRMEGHGRRREAALDESRRLAYNEEV